MTSFQKSETNWNARLFLVIGILVAFTSLIALLILSYLNIPGSHSAIIQFFIDYHLAFMVVMVFLGVAVGITIYYILTGKIKEKNETIKGTGKLLLNLLNSDEKEVLEYLVKNNGITNQYELTYLKGMTRLKVHRILEKLEEKQIISRTRIGKINKIKMTENVFQALKDLT